MGEDERKISVKNKDMYIKKNCGDSAVLFCEIRTEGDRRACTGRHPTGRSPYKKEEPHFCGSKGEKVYEKVFFLRTIIVYKLVV